MSERERIEELRALLEKRARHKHGLTPTQCREALDGWERALGWCDEIQARMIRERAEHSLDLDEARELVRRLCDEGGHCSCDSLPDGYKCKSCKVFSAADVKVSEWGLS